MKAFFVGFFALVALFLLAAIGFLLYPFLLALVLFLRVIAFLVLIILGIWLFGKFIIFVWEKMRGRGGAASESSEETGRRVG